MMKNGTLTPQWPAANPAGSAAIEVAQLVKLYKTTRAVDGVSFRIAPGSITGLLGWQWRRQDHDHRHDHGTGAAALRTHPGAGLFDARAKRRGAGEDEFREPLRRYADAAHGAAESHHLRPALRRSEPARAHRETCRRSRSRRFPRPCQRQALGRAEDAGRAGESADQPARIVVAGRTDGLARSRYRRLDQAASRDLSQGAWRNHPAGLAQHA